jgi:hypothetical protein
VASERGEPELFVEPDVLRAGEPRLAGNGAWVPCRGGARRAVLGARFLCRGKGPG